ncbi:hypothetical protein GGI25_004485 [Coemansia spiralis]|uniref:BZIP domain-containing protein n=2 Tax=Coemansia TaxID=4863 RepID=A0A9W8KVI7_9FUNG|nr:hypothetical protein EDC05_005239 [Coemansia umbellata]KAJ2619831.1 hypothetical protein GGI26_005505 [Coemansia sp. RSA 1358]KAJ2674000.1 hypothetical protein GGI25_004485 [Coemansia spiralis]
MVDQPEQPPQQLQPQQLQLQQQPSQLQLQPQQPVRSIRTILPNGVVDPSPRRSIYADALQRKREKNRLAARRKRDRRKKKLEDLEKHEVDLLKKRQELQAELRVYRERNTAIYNPHQNYRSPTECDEEKTGSSIGAEIATLRDSIEVVCRQTKEIVAVLEIAHLQAKALLDQL